MVTSTTARTGVPLSASELDQVAGGNVYYSLFFWIGEHLGAAERLRQEEVAENPLSEFTYL